MAETINIPSGLTRVFVRTYGFPGAAVGDPSGTTQYAIHGGSWLTLDTSTQPDTGVTGDITFVASENQTNSARSLTLTITATTSPDERYDGIASATCAYTITQAAGSTPPGPIPGDRQIEITFDGYIQPLNEIYFALATANTPNAIVASGSSPGLDVETICSYEIPSPTTPLWLFYKGNTRARIYIGIGTGPEYRPWLGGNEHTYLDFTTDWQSSGQSVSAWSESKHYLCPLYSPYE